MTNIPTSSAAQGQGQGQDKAISSSSSSRSRQASPSPSPTKILGMPPPVPPHMQRGFTEPCTAYSSARSLESPRNRKEDLVELGREFGSGDVCRTPSTVTATATPGGHSVQEPEKESGAPRGRPSALEKSKSLSPRGKWGMGIGSQARSVSAERERSRSASPRRVVSARGYGSCVGERDRNFAWETDCHNRCCFGVGFAPLSSSPSRLFFPFRGLTCFPPDIVSWHSCEKPRDLFQAALTERESQSDLIDRRRLEPTAR